MRMSDWSSTCPVRVCKHPAPSRSPLPSVCQCGLDRDGRKLLIWLSYSYVFKTLRKVDKLVIKKRKFDEEASGSNVMVDDERNSAVPSVDLTKTMAVASKKEQRR